MIGILPRLWVSHLRKIATAAQVADILLSVGHPPHFEYALDQPYGDAECASLMQASFRVLSLSEDELFASFAQDFIRDSVQRWPVWFEMAPTARDFLERQPRIHDRFSRGMSHHDLKQHPYQSKFDISRTDQGLKVLYASPNRLCRLYLAMAQALLAHYGDDQARLSQPCCVHRDDPLCEIHITWPPCTLAP